MLLQYRVEFNWQFPLYDYTIKSKANNNNYNSNNFNHMWSTIHKEGVVIGGNGMLGERGGRWQKRFVPQIDVWL